MFGGIGIGEVIIVLFLLMLLFGAKRIPDIARGVGEGIRNFKTGVKEPERLEDGEASGTDEDERRA